MCYSVVNILKTPDKRRGFFLYLEELLEPIAHDILGDGDHSESLGGGVKTYGYWFLHRWMHFGGGVLWTVD